MKDNVTDPPSSSALSATTPGSGDVPIPPRYWWLKRFVVAGGVLILGLAVLRWWWGWEAERRLQAEIQRYRQAGQPVFVHEIDAELDAVPDAENAAVLLEKAIGKIVAGTDGANLDDYRNYLGDRSLFETKRSQAAELMDKNAEALALIREARDRPKVAWSWRLADSVTNPVPNVLSLQRVAAKLLWFATAYHFETGNHAEAVETLRDFVAFNEAVAAHPTIISSLVAWACNGLAFAIVEALGARLTIEVLDLPQNEATTPARREQIEALIRESADETQDRRAMTRAVYGDRAENLNLLKRFGKFGRQVLFTLNPVPPPAWSRMLIALYRPALVTDTVRQLRVSALQAEAAGESNWPAAGEYFTRTAQEHTFLRLLSRPGTVTAFGSEYDSGERIVQIHFRHLARWRMAATALAIRLFVVDHGHRPDALESLVSHYLPAVPRDPFSADEAPIRYRTAPEPAVLYSVSLNGTDDGGTPPERGWFTGDGDFVFYLDGRPTKDGQGASPSVPQAGEDDEDAEDD